jgi:hypothetical protein
LCKIQERFASSREITTITIFFLFTYSFAHIHNYRPKLLYTTYIHTIFYHHSPFFLATVPLKSTDYGHSALHAREMADKLIGISPSRPYVRRPRRPFPAKSSHRRTPVFLDGGHRAMESRRITTAHDSKF